MKKRHFLLGLMASLFLAVILSCSNTAYATTDATHPGFKVKGKFLYDCNDEKTILYGINKMIVWMDKDGDPSFQEIAKTGANCVRIVWTTTDGTPDELDTAITNCRANHMIPIVELHDATGKFDQLQSLVDWWVKPEVVKVLQKHEQYLLINIGNEVGDGNVSDATFTAGYTKAVTRMRTAGIHVPLLIDGSSWGQDINKLQACGPDLIENDPDSNIMLSVHCWWPAMYGHNAEEVEKEFKESNDMELPLVVGEFANQWEETTQGQIPYKTVMKCCAEYGYGYLIWSWGPGNQPQTFLDMTTDSTFDTLQPWAKEMLFEDEYALKKLVKTPKSLLSGLPAQMPAKPLKSGNLALGKDVEFSSKESAGYEGNNITDGLLDTRWATSSSDSTGMVTIDLGEEKVINEVLIKWENAYATQYKIQVSKDGKTWDDAYTNYGGKGGLDDVTLEKEVSARYVRINCSQKINYSWGYSIWEVGVYGPDSLNGAVVTPDTAVFDKNVKNREDLKFTLDTKGNTLTAVKNGKTVLKEGTDYVIEDGTLTISKAYLATLEKGTIQLQLVFDNGLNPLINIAIGDTTPIGGVIPGDINGDGTVNIADYSLFRKYLNNDGKGIKIDTDNADVNQDGAVDFFDLVALKALI